MGKKVSFTERRNKNLHKSDNFDIMKIRNYFSMRYFRVYVHVFVWTGYLFGITFWSTIAVSIEEALARGFLTAFCQAANFYVPYYIFIPKYLDKKKYVKFGLGIFILGLVVFLARYFLETKLFTHFGMNAKFLDSTPRLVFLIIMIEVIIISFSILLRMAQKKFEMERRLLKENQLRLESELRFFKAQMSPHFLFNTLNNIYSLSLLQSEQTPEAILKLSQLLRYLLYECDKPFISLQREVESLQLFIELYQLKYEEKLKVKLEVLGDIRYAIEPMILIPLLENAFKYSGVGDTEEGFIHIKIKAEAERLHFDIINSRQMEYQPSTSYGGIGLENIRRRLKVKYPDNHAFSISETLDSFEVKLQLAVEKGI